MIQVFMESIDLLFDHLNKTMIEQVILFSEAKNKRVLDGQNFFRLSIKR